MAKGRNRRKYVHSNSGGQKNGQKNAKNAAANANGQVKNHQLYDDQLKVEKAEQKIHDENFHNIDNNSDDNSEKISDFDDVVQQRSENENRRTENGEPSSAASIVNDLVYSKYNAVSPVYMKPVNSVCGNALDDHRSSSVVSRTMGQETSKNSAVPKPVADNVVATSEDEVFYEAKDAPMANGQFEQSDKQCDIAFNSDDGCVADVGSDTMKKAAPMSVKEDSISLPDVVESRCIIVLDQPADLDTITAKTGKTFAAVDKLNQEM
jgi:hypothetical protein